MLTILLKTIVNADFCLRGSRFFQYFEHGIIDTTEEKANIEFRVPYSRRYLALGLVGLVELVELWLPLLLRLGLVGLALWLVSGSG